MPTTANGIPYPAGTDTPDGAAQIQALAAFLDPMLAWSTYTPTITGTGWSAGGGGVVTGRWVKIGKTVHVRITFTLGTTGYGTGALTLSLPATATAVSHIGVASFFDTSGSARYSGAALANASTVQPLVGPAAAGGQDRGITSTVPVAPGVGDVVTVALTYEAA